MNSFHFIRPWCFLLLVLLPPLLLLVTRHGFRNGSWSKVVAPQLLPHLLQGEGSSGKNTLALALILVLFATGVTALAGPAWRQVEQPVFRTTAALILVLDLSLSMDTQDIKPSRIKRVKLKLFDILKQRKDGHTGLIVYAAHPYVLSPVTTDSATIAAQVNSLSTNLMPSRGSRPDRALKMAVDLIRQTGITKGDILLVTDGTGELDPEKIAPIADGYRLSVLGVGTLEGGPVKIPDQGFLVDEEGDIVLARLNETNLYHLARAGGGRYHRLSGDDSDLNYLLTPMQPGTGDRPEEQETMQSAQFKEEGPMLVALLLPFVALFFRRGILTLVFLVSLTISGQVRAMEWNSLWLNKNQQGSLAFRENRPGEAAELFLDQDWKAAAQYAAGKYDQALKTLEHVDTPDVHYNRGNALARLGRLEDALAAYNQAILDNPDNNDAVANRDLIKKILEQQKQQSQKQDQKQQEQLSDQDSRQQSQQENSKSLSNHQQDQSSDKDGFEQVQNKQSGDKEEQADSTQQSQPQDFGSSPEEQPEHKDVQAGKADGNPDPVTSESDNRLGELEQLLRKIPDDPGGLWRRKFMYQYQQQYRQLEEEKQVW